MIVIKMVALFLLYFSPFVSFAQIVITEVMYDLPGSDTDREWIEVFNKGDGDIDVSEWRFNDGANHKLVISEEKGGQGTLTIVSGEYAILASDAVRFLSDYAEFSGTVIDTVMSLGQQEDRAYTLQLIDEAGILSDEMSYTVSLGANGDGDSLQKSADTWVAKTPTPGTKNAAEGDYETDPSEDSQEFSEHPETSKEDDSGASSSEESSSYYGIEPQKNIKAFIRKHEPVAGVGAQVRFEGYALGFKGEPLALHDVRYLWSFGDGTRGEGKSVAHTYKYPGEYIVVLEVSLGEYSASDRFILKVVPIEVVIFSLGPPNDFFVELLNKSSYEVNLDGWILVSGKEHFRIPAKTFIMPSKKLILPPHVTRFTYDENVSLHYPDGKNAPVYNDSRSSQVKNKPDAVRVQVSKNPQEAEGEEYKESSVPDDMFEEEEREEEEDGARAHVAAVGSTRDDGGNNSSFLSAWFFATFLLIAAALSGFFFLRGSPEEDIGPEEKLAYEMELDEEETKDKLT